MRRYSMSTDVHVLHVLTDLLLSLTKVGKKVSVLLACTSRMIAKTCILTNYYISIHILRSLERSSVGSN